MAAGDIALRLVMTAQTGEAVRAVSEVTKALGIGGMAGTLAIAGGAVAALTVALGVVAVKAAADFETQTTRLVTSAGELQSNLDMVRQGLLQLSVDTATSTEQLSAGMYYVESAGFHAAAGLEVMRAAAEGAKSENADLDTVAKALTTVMVDYHMSANQASDAMNGLIAAVQNGKTNLQNLASSMGNVLPIASSLGIDFANVAGVMDTMTNSGMSARQAAQNLAHVLLALSAPSKIAVSSMADVGLSAQAVKDALVNQGLPEALQMIEDAVGKKFPKGSVAYEQALKNILGGIVGVKLAAQLTGANLAMTQQNIDKVAAAMKNGHGSVLGFAEVQGTLNFKVDQAKQALHALFITIGTQLLPVVGNIVGAITPVISNMAVLIAQGNNLKILMIALTALIVGLVTPAVWSLAAGVIAATWPFLLIAAAIGGLVAAFLHFYNTNAGFKSFIDGAVNGLKQLWTTISTNLLPALQQLGIWFQQHILPFLQQFADEFQSQIQPTLASLSDTVQNTLIPAWNSLQAAGEALLPLLQFVGIIIGIVLVLALGILAGAIRGVISGLGPLIAGIAQFFGGLVLLVSGAIQLVVGLVGGLIKVIGDLLGGNFDRIGGDFVQIWNNLSTGVKNIALGLWHMLLGLFQASVGTIWNVVAGFVKGVIDFFSKLKDQLVGNSIVPDMINAVVNWFKSLPGWVFQQLQNLIIGAIARFQLLAKEALRWVGQMASWVMTNILGMKQGTVDRIMQMVNLVISLIAPWVNRVVGFAKQMLDQFIGQIKRFLQDPIGTVQSMVSKILSIIGALPNQLFQSGVHMVQLLIQGIVSMIPSLGQVIDNIATTINNTLGFSLPKEGPLSRANEWMPDFGNLLASGLHDQISKVRAAATRLSSAIAQPQSFALSSSNNAPAQMQPGAVYLDKQKVGQILFGYGAKEIRRQGGVRNH